MNAAGRVSGIPWQVPDVPRPGKLDVDG